MQACGAGVGFEVRRGRGWRQRRRPVPVDVPCVSGERRPPRGVRSGVELGLAKPRSEAGWQRAKTSLPATCGLAYRCIRWDEREHCHSVPVVLNSARRPGRSAR